MDDVEYFRQRQADEQARAERAGHPLVRRAHSDLARRYARLVQERPASPTPP